MTLITTLLEIAMAGAQPAPAPEAMPLRLETAREGDRVVVRVIGSSKIERELNYRLDVSSMSGSNRNNTVQNGRVHLTPGSSVTASQTSLRVAPGGEWRVELKVSGSSNYSTVASSSDEG